MNFIKTLKLFLLFILVLSTSLVSAQECDCDDFGTPVVNMVSNNGECCHYTISIGGVIGADLGCVALLTTTQFGRTTVSGMGSSNDPNSGSFANREICADSPFSQSLSYDGVECWSIDLDCPVTPCVSDCIVTIEKVEGACVVKPVVENCEGPLEYAWSYPNLDGRHSTTGSGIIVRQANGEYCVFVTDEDGCESSDCIVIDSCEEGHFDCLEVHPPVNFGDPCDDGDPNTSNDVITTDCECIGT